MRPARRIKQAEEAGRILKALLSSPVISQLLQRTPPAALTAEQEAQLSRCCNVIQQLSGAVDEAPSLSMQLMDAMLKQQVVCNIGRLVTWVQQQPEQQRLDLEAAAAAGRQGSYTYAAGRTPTIIWAAGVHLLTHFAAVAKMHVRESAEACSLAENLTQQLDQSGKACSGNYRCTTR
jgi:hypothetical protein